VAKVVLSKSYLDGEALSLIYHIAVCIEIFFKMRGRNLKIVISFIQNFLSLPTANIWISLSCVG